MRCPSQSSRTPSHPSAQLDTASWQASSSPRPASSSGQPPDSPAPMRQLSAALNDCLLEYSLIDFAFPSELLSRELSFRASVMKEFVLGLIDVPEFVRMLY